MTKDLLDFSNYLKNIKRAHGKELEALTGDDSRVLAELVDRAGHPGGCDGGANGPGSTVAEQLRALKALFSYRWAHARIGHSVDSDALGRLQTAFAEATINRALAAAWSEKTFAALIGKGQRAPDGTVPGLFVLGLGKLAGYDLNFSSDVDLVAFYDPEVLPVPEMYGRMDVCAKVLKRMTQTLSKSMGGEFVWRVDWRLRPDASVNPIVMSSPAALDFYFFRSLPWHRLAMIKARVVAGDLESGDRFLKALEPYLWRQNLDYTAVDDLYRLKQKINQEHPQLKLARMAEARGLHQTEGFNLKLGKGGIREIEFIVNAMQLLWGGKKPELRTSSTVDVLQALNTTGLFEEPLSETLAKNYRRLRLIEDALQIRENLQTHSLPKSEQTLSELHQLLGGGGRPGPEQQVDQCTAAVSCEYQRFFSSLSPASNRQLEQMVDFESLDWFQKLPNAEQNIVAGWSRGFTLYAVPTSGAGQLIPLFNRLVELISAQRTGSAKLVDKLHQFFRSTPRGGQYLRLLCAQPGMLEEILEPLAGSPAMAALLEQSPHIIDYMLEPATASDTGFDSDFVRASPDFDTRLKRLRTFVNEQLYDIMLGFFSGRLGSLEIQKKLTHLAEHCLNLGLEITAEDLGFSEPPIAVLGMGKLGMKAMAPLSDLDLILIANAGVELEQANRFSNRFRHLMEVKTPEGRAYEMDTRLRPSGRSGPVIVTVESFERYHLNSARSWEHIALLPSRVVSGLPEMRRKVGSVRARILGRQRSRKQFLLDAGKMHSRVRGQRIGRGEEGAMHVKLRRGGMFETDYLCACLALLSGENASAFHLDYDQLMDQILKNAGQPALAASIRFWRSLQIWSRILGLENGPLELIHPKRLDLLLTDMKLASPEALREQTERHSELVGNSLESVLSEAAQYDPGDWHDWDEVSVVWQDQ